MHQEPIRGESIFLIHDFPSPEECEHFIEETERRGYTDAPITSVYGTELRPEVRNNERVMVDDPELAERLFERAASLLPQRLSGWRLLGFNERFRYYRSNGEESFLTFMVYLNDGYAGGTTEFYSSNGQSTVSIKPRAGMALVFIHDLCHEGAVIQSGRKYVLRTDVMYRRDPGVPHRGRSTVRSER